MGLAVSNAKNEQSIDAHMTSWPELRDARPIRRPPPVLDVTKHRSRGGIVVAINFENIERFGMMDFIPDCDPD